MSGLNVRIGIGVTLLGLGVTGHQPAREAVSANAADHVVLTQRLPRMNGGELKMTVVEVSYAPGASSPPHSHPCPVFVYVIQGAMRSQVKGGPETVYRAGEGFYEEANGVHQISGNASQQDSVRFLASFLCDRQVPLSVPAPQQ